MHKKMHQDNIPLNNSLFRDILRQLNEFMLTDGLIDHLSKSVGQLTP